MIVLACDVPGCAVSEAISGKYARLPAAWRELPTALREPEQHVCPVHVRELEKAKNRILGGAAP